MGLVRISVDASSASSSMHPRSCPRCGIGSRRENSSANVLLAIEPVGPFERSNREEMRESGQKRVR
eukprot:5454774-Pyramimonas_sp.AAC.1